VPASKLRVARSAVVSNLALIEMILVMIVPDLALILTVLAVVVADLMLVVSVLAVILCILTLIRCILPVVGVNLAAVLIDLLLFRLRTRGVAAGFILLFDGAVLLDLRSIGADLLMVLLDLLVVQIDLLAVLLDLLLVAADLLMVLFNLLAVLMDLLVIVLDLLLVLHNLAGLRQGRDGHHDACNAKGDAYPVQHGDTRDWWLNQRDVVSRQRPARTMLVKRCFRAESGPNLSHRGILNIIVFQMMKAEGDVEGEAVRAALTARAR